MTRHREKKLPDRAGDAIRAKHYSPRTEEAYVNWIKRYILFQLTFPTLHGFSRGIF